MSSPSVTHTQITESKLAKINNSTSKDRFIRDTELRGFGVRLSPKNVKSYFIEATVHGKFVRRVIGQHPLTSLLEARRTALEALRELRYGSGSPRTGTNQKVLLRTVAEGFLLDKKAVLRPSTMADYSMVLQGSYFDSWMERPVLEIRRREVLDHYRNLCSTHGAGMANKSMRVLSSALNYGKAVEPSLEEWGNPVRVLSETRSKVQIRARTSYIKPEDLGKWLSALDDYKAQCRPQEQLERRADIWLLLRLMLMTGLRSNEARSLTWKDVELDKGVLTIRASIAKNHREAQLPINSWLIDQLSKRLKVGEYIFLSECGTRYVDNLRRPLERLQQLSGIRVTPHDLRRTFATYMDLLGAPFGAIKQMLNHVSNSDITAQYIQRRDIDQLRQYSEKLLMFIADARIESKP